MGKFSLEEGEDWKEVIPPSYCNHETENPLIQKVEDEPSNRKCCKNVNRDLIAPKAFYLIFFGANGTLMPYLILFFKQLGLTPSQVGIVSGLKPFISFVCSPLWGYIADKSGKTLLIYIVSLLAYAGGYLAYSFAPHDHVCKIQRNATMLHKSHFPLPFNNWKKKLHLKKRFQELDINSKNGDKHKRNSNIFDAYYRRLPEFSDESITGKRERVSASSKNIDPYQHYYQPAESEMSLFQVPPSINFFNPSETSTETESNTQNIPEYEDAVEIEGVIPQENEHSWLGAIRSSKSPWTVCAAAKANSITEINYQTINGVEFDLHSIFRYLLIITIFATIFSCPLITIVDTATIRILKRKNETQKYGKQRLWGSLGWGMSSFGVGSFIATIALCPGVNNEVSYYPAFYVFAGLQLIALLIGLKLDFNSEEEICTIDNAMSRTQKISQGLSLMKEPIYFFFIVTSFYIGIVMSIIKTFLFWHLKDIGGTQMLFSIVSAINCVAEVFVYFFSATFIERVGHIRVLYIALTCYSLRLFYYGLLPNPWYVLAAEPLSGITTAAAWASMTSYVGLNANHQSVTTLQGILHGVHWGLGHGVGELIGGFMVSWIGAAMTFNAFGVLTIIELLFFILIIHLNTPKEKSSETNNEKEKESATDEAENGDDNGLQGNTECGSKQLDARADTDDYESAELHREDKSSVKPKENCDK